MLINLNLTGINGALTPAQNRTGASDSYDAFTADVMKSGGGRSSAELVDIIVRGSSEVRIFKYCLYFLVSYILLLLYQAARRLEYHI